MSIIKDTEVMTNEYDIEIYQTASGKEPFTEWLESLKDSSAKRTIFVRLQRIRQGNFGDCHSVGNGLQELRIHLGPGYRVYFGNIANKLILLFGGGKKVTQKKDIKLCKDFLRDYREQCND